MIFAAVFFALAIVAAGVMFACIFVVAAADEKMQQRKVYRTLCGVGALAATAFAVFSLASLGALAAS